jgi:hypothetical protein
MPTPNAISGGRLLRSAEAEVVLDRFENGGEQLPVEVIEQIDEGEDRQCKCGGAAFGHPERSRGIGIRRCRHSVTV